MLLSVSGNVRVPGRRRRIGRGLPGSVHAVTAEGTLVLASVSGSQLTCSAWDAANVINVVGAQKLVATLERAYQRIYTHSLLLKTAARRRSPGSTARSASSSRSTRNWPATNSTSSSSASRWHLSRRASPIGWQHQEVLMALNAKPEDSRAALAPLDEEADHE
jgi:hypothetical protein